ncbi:MAG: aspartate/glutamate racemase family protein [Aeromicrobium sp.]|uniref:aspartate/glutamate racemase family protein n=1 Tax=Aeromicrobium sp. TaxID=1871063 RepID=UPI0026242CD7|nr:aspartate/glutamate racemase family protein [Aeromicrobium sp.]MDF1704185.1 aspartate/glutamate racemase family protein [Aeromicrobium sp.]
MRTIGLIGGMSWESTAEYYRILNESVRDRLGGLHSARVIVDSLDFAEVAALQSAGAWTEAGQLLADRAARLEQAGADLVVLATNTMHLVADAIQARLSVPFLHIGDAAADAIEAAGVTVVGLLGTRFTMENPFLVDHLSRRGLRVLLPPAQDRTLVHDVIYDELVQGVVREESRLAYAEVIDRLVAAGAEGVLLGCTEIELLVTPGWTRVPTFPTTRLHAEAAAAAALAP